ncbi:MAG: hypothetical protein SFU87_11480 [Chitinophagaceae bacterium]|nr:hypothetical protein [Chitinophagaceae bacterium]
MKVLFILTTIVLFSCQLQQETKTKNEQKQLKADDPLSVQQKPDSVKIIHTAPPSFLDSINGKYKLSIAQIKNHTSVDSVYYTGMFADVGFTGDTVFNFYRGFSGAVIDYDDRRSCVYKFLLVFNPVSNQNIANKIIYTDCDHDESADYITLRYRLLNDSTFETTETQFPAKSKAPKIEKLKWKISNNGIIQLPR